MKHTFHCTINMNIFTKDEFDKIFSFKPKIFPTRKVLKKLKVSKNSLTREEVNSLIECTNYTEEEVISWFSRFLKVCPQGALTRKKVDH